MSAENARKFEALLRDDAALRAKLEQAAAAYSGDRSDERALFDAAVAPIAEEVGLPYTFDEIMAAKDSRELDETELGAVAGGTGFCIFIGGSDDVDSGCNVVEGHACAYIGVGVPHIVL